MISPEFRDTSQNSLKRNKSSSWQARFVRENESTLIPIADDVLEHRVDWLLTQCDRPDKAVLVLEDGEGPALPLFVHDGRVDLNFGELSIASLQVRRHVLVGNLSGFAVDNWHDPLTAFAQIAPRKTALFLLGVVLDEPLDKALHQPDVRKLFFILRQGGSYRRRLCDISQGFDAYLRNLSAKSRQSMRRSLRRFEANFDGRFTFQAYQDADEIATFLSKVESVSRRTYQGQMLGLAVTRSGFIGNKALQGAKLGLARCYSLCIDQKPIAWRIGFTSGKVFFSHHIGYDPEFENWHPGVVLHLYSIRHISSTEDGIETLDFLYGDNDFKRRASHRSRDEQNYYLFPRTLHGAFYYISLSTCNAISENAGKFLEYVGLKKRLKSFLRR